MKRTAPVLTAALLLLAGCLSDRDPNINNPAMPDGAADSEIAATGGGTASGKTGGTITGIIYCDLNGNGIQDPCDPPIAGAGVDLDLYQGGSVYTDWVPSGPDGRYTFTNVPPGNAKLDVVYVPQSKTGGPNCPLQVRVQFPPGTNLEIDFCLVERYPKPNATIGDLVYCDLNNNGTQDPGEPGIPNVTVNLNCTDVYGNFFNASQVTDAMGGYLFTDLEAGECHVEVDLSTLPADCSVSDQCPTSYDITLAPGDCYLDADFCFTSSLGSIGDFVWCDLNDDGNQDPGEPGLAGVVLDLVCTAADGTVTTATATTDGSGFYLFSGLEPGDCVVTVDVTTAPPDCNVEGQCPTVVTHTLLPGEQFLDADFCFKPSAPGSIGDFVWCDLNNDGVQDPGEPGLAGVVLNLTCTAADGSVTTASATTDGSGFYLFTNVPAGACDVTVDVTTAPPDCDQVGQCVTTVSHDLQPGEDFRDADFCFYPAPGSIGDFVWCDLDDDGVQDPGEPGIAGVLVSLTCTDANGNVTTASQATDANGYYLFTGLAPGTCDVSIDPSTAPADCNQIGQCPTSRTHVLQAGEVYLDADFCLKPTPITPSDCCADGKLVQITMIYTGDDCSATSHTQAADKVSCTGDPMSAAVVHILVTDKEDPADSKAKVFFNGDVALGASFDIAAATAGQSTLKSNTWVHVTDSATGATLQTINFHTSCSQPLFTGDQFGSLLLIACIGEDTPTGGGGGTSCDDGDPEVLTMRYTGEDCSASSNGQPSDKFVCSGDPGFAPVVRVRATDKEDPADSKAKVYFDGNVVLDGLFDIDANVVGDSKLKSKTFLHVTDPATGASLQFIEFHTSCSQPLGVGDQFGAFLLEVFTPEP